MTTKQLIPSAIVLLLFCGYPSVGYCLGFKSRLTDVIKNKKYSKKHRIEISGGGGSILNESYVQTMFGGGALTFFISEEWGVELAGGLAIVGDRNERLVLENWRNPESKDQMRFNPVYPELNEHQFYGALNIIFSPFYAKQLVLFSLYTNFDIYFSGGIGVTNLTYYSRYNAGKEDKSGDFVQQFEEIPGSSNEALVTETLGYTADKATKYGRLGREYIYGTVAPQMAPTFNVGFGQRYFFLKRMIFRFDVKDYIALIKNENGEFQLNSDFVIWVGMGVML